jgi:hypothetical protein
MNDTGGALRCLAFFLSRAHWLDFGLANLFSNSNSRGYNKLVVYTRGIRKPKN